MKTIILGVTINYLIQLKREDEVANIIQNFERKETMTGIIYLILK